MMKGKIKFVNKDGGWGFITGEDNQDVFFHVTNFMNKEDALKIYDGVLVEFEVGQGKKGNKAINIRRLVNGS